MKRHTYPRGVLNRLRWEEGRLLEKAEVVIIHRGAPDDKRTISGCKIIRIGHAFFETTETSIPYHRILEIRYDGKILFEKKPKEK